MRGLTELKLHELILHMGTYNIDILCIQETWTKNADVYEEQGHLIVLSGGSCPGRVWSGVGFIISPRIRDKIRGYKQINDRIAYVKLKLEGGVLALFTIYAPHNLKPLGERIDFY